MWLKGLLVLWRHEQHATEEHAERIAKVAHTAPEQRDKTSIRRRERLYHTTTADKPDRERNAYGGVKVKLRRRRDERERVNMRQGKKETKKREGKTKNEGKRKEEKEEGKRKERKEGRSDNANERNIRRR